MQVAEARRVVSSWRTLDEIRAFADRWIGKNLVTIQTDENGQPISKIYVESCTDIERELYLSAVIDRGSREWCLWRLPKAASKSNRWPKKP